MEIAFSSFLLDHAVDDVLDTTDVDLAFQERLHVLVLALHLHEVDAHVLSSFGVFIDSSKNLAEVAHVDTPFMQEVFQTLGIDRDSLLLLQVLDQVRDRLLSDVGRQFCDVLFLSFKLFCSHVQLNILLEDISVKAVFGCLRNESLHLS